MTRPWLRPLVAGVTAVILGVTGAIVGAQLAAPTIVETSPTTVTAPIVAPVGVGVEALDADLDPTAETVALSEAVGEREVPLPTSLGSASEAPSDVFAALAEADDPLAEIVLFEADADADARRTGDACAPVDGASPEGCPEGLRSTILPLLSPPDLQLFAGANLPRPAGSAVPGSYATCPPRAIGSGRVNISVASTTPLTELTFRYSVTSAGGVDAVVADPIADRGDPAEHRGNRGIALRPLPVPV